MLYYVCFPPKALFFTGVKKEKGRERERERERDGPNGQIKGASICTKPQKLSSFASQLLDKMLRLLP